MTLVQTWRADWRSYLLLGGLCLCLYLPGLRAIPVLDRDEARFAQATRQMLETGDFLDIRFQDDARNKKPAGIYWLQAAAVSLFSTPESTAIWPYRLPSLIGATLAVLFAFGFGRELLRGVADEAAASRTALIAAVLLATALGTVAEAHIAKTDAMLLTAIVAGQGALGLCYLRTRGGGTIDIGLPVTFWLAQIAAIYLKGPVGPALAVATAATLTIADRDLRWLRQLRPGAGLVAVAFAVGPWIDAIQRATKGQFLADALGHDFLAKITGAQESHGAPPLYYLALSLVTFWPGSLYLAPALIRGWHRHEEPVVRFLLAWIVPAWVVLELVPTKLPNYALPLYPALALLAAGALVDGGRSDEPRWERWASTGVAALWGLVTLLIAAATIVLPIRFGGGVGIVIFGIVSAALIVLLAAWLYRRPGNTPLLAALALIFVVPAAGRVVPHLTRLWLSRDAADMVARQPGFDGATLTVIGYNEPSLVFLLGGRVRFTMPGGAATLATGAEALVNDRQAPMFAQELAPRGLLARPLDSVHGTDYSNGQHTRLTLYRIEPK